MGSAGRTEPSGWRAVLVLFFITSVMESVGVSHVFSFLPIYLGAMHVPEVTRWVGVLTALPFVVGLPLVPLWGTWADRYGGKAVIIRSAVVEAAVFSLLGVSRSLGGTAAALALTGFQLGNTGVMLAAIRRLVPESRVGFAVSLFSVSSPVGMALGPLVGGWLVDNTPLGLHGLFGIDGALSVGTALMLQLLYRERRRRRAPPLGPTASAWHDAWSSVRLIFSLPVAWRLFGVYTLLMVARQMMVPYLPIAIAAVNPYPGREASVVGALLGLSALVGALITVAAGRLGDRAGFVRVLVLAMAGAAVLAPPLGLLRHLAPLAADLGVYSAAVQIGGAMVFALLSTRIPEPHRATALNLVYLPLYVAGIVGPGLASALSPLGLPVQFATAGLIFAASGVASGLWLPRTAGAEDA